MRLRKRGSQHLHRRKRMDNIAHGAEPHDQQPFDLTGGSNIESIRLETHMPKTRGFDAHLFLGVRRERIMSLVEWFFASPTIAPPPPYSASVSRSGTESTV